MIACPLCVIEILTCLRIIARAPHLPSGYSPPPHTHTQPNPHTSSSCHQYGALIVAGWSHQSGSAGLFPICPRCNISPLGCQLCDVCATELGAGAPVNSISGSLFSDTNRDGTQAASDETTEKEGRDALRDTYLGVSLDLVDANGTVMATTVTDTAGNYLFDGLIDGTYTVIVTDSDQVLVGLTHSDGPHDGQDHNSQPQSGYVVSVSGGEEDTTGDFGYFSNSISGTIWEDADASGTHDVGETLRFGGVTVDLVGADGSIVSTAITDPVGSYLFANLRDGTYTVHVSDTAEVLRTYALTDGQNDGSDLNSQLNPYTVAVSAGRHEQSADFGFVRPSSAPTRAPTQSTAEPTSAPTALPTPLPTLQPSTNPTVQPTTRPSNHPTPPPTPAPTPAPTNAPTVPFPAEITRVYTEVTVGSVSKLLFWMPPAVPFPATDPITRYQIRLRVDSESAWMNTVELTKEECVGDMFPFDEYYVDENEWGLVRNEHYWVQIRAHNDIGGWFPWGEGGTTGYFNTN